MTYRDCETCGRMGWSGDRHTCPPVHLVWCPEYGQSEDGDAKQVRASSAEAAAIAWAEKQDRDSADYTIVAGSDATVHVKGPDGAVSVFVVSGESVPVYTARMAKAGGAP